MNRKAQKLTRAAAIVALLSAFALPCAGWGWDGVYNGDSAGDAAAAQSD